MISSPARFVPTRANRPYLARGAAMQAWRSARREVLLAGPAGTGKTRLWCEKLHHCAMKYPGMRALMCRKTRHSLTQTAMVTYETKVLPDGWMDNIIHFNSTDQQYEYPNGSILAVGGLDKPSKVMSSEWDMIFVPEATELFEDDWQSLTTRLRNGVMPYQQLGADCNPSYPTHWLKRRCDRGTVKHLVSRHEDNPAVTKEYLQTLADLTGVLNLRLYKGIWAAAEGMVYSEWDRGLHVARREQLLAWHVLNADELVNHEVIKRVICGVDFGWTNPGIMAVIGLDYDDRAFLLREVYRTHQTIDWWLAEGKKLKKAFEIERFICDPSRPDYIEQLNSAGLRAEKATNDILLGVGAVQERLKIAGDGRPTFYVYEYANTEPDRDLDALHLPYTFEQEIDGYAWQKAKPGQDEKELPVPVQNHALDAVRYALMFLKKPQVTGGILLPALDNVLAEQGWQDESDWLDERISWWSN